jgi:hypothetical protein
VAGGALVLMIPPIVAGIAVMRPQWYPTGDMAQAELHVRGFWSHPPLVGAAGRIQDAAGVQGSHPGPLLWLALWPVYALGSSTSAALVVSVVLVHLVAIALALWLAARRGGAVFAVALGAALAIVVRAGGPDMLTEPWNPWMGLLPFLALVLAVWSVLDGERWAIVLAVAAGSYCIQAHVGYVIVVTGLLALAATTMIVETVRADRRGAATWPATAAWLGAATVLGVVMWIPPIIDQLGRQPGNLSILRSSFGDPDGPYLGAAEVAEIAAVQFNLMGPWVFGPQVDSFDAVRVLGLAGFVALWVAGVVSARRRGATSELHLHAVLAVVVALAIVSISRIFGLYFEYTVRWVWFVAATVVAASVTSLWRSRHVTGRVPAALGLIAVVAYLSVGAWQFAARAGPTGAVDSRIVDALSAEVTGDLEAGGRHLVRWWDPVVLGATGIGMVLELERQGFTVGVDRQFAAAALPHRVMPEETADDVLYVVSGESAIGRARTLPGLEELGAYDVRSASERARSVELRAAIEDGLVRAGQADRVPVLDASYGLAQLQFGSPPVPPAIRDELEEYIALRQPTAVFRTAPGTPVVPLG